MRYLVNRSQRKFKVLVRRLRGCRLTYSETSVPGRHRNQNVPVFRRVGERFDELFRTTREKAERLIASKFASLRDKSRGVCAGIIVEPRSRPSRSPNSAAVIESTGMYAAAVENGCKPQESLGELIAFVRSRSPYRWTERPRITPKRR
jgi:hypothetical protein